MKLYKAGLIKSPWGRKFEWQLEENTDRLSCEIYEFHEIKAKNKQEAVNELNRWYGGMFKGTPIKARPFQWGNGWW
jgi:hypothetical protein